MRKQRAAVEPWELLVAYAYPEVRWHELPVFQTYAAYTTPLDRLNVDALTSSSRPRFVLREMGASVDGRIPRFESPGAALATLCHYRTVLTDGHWQLFEATHDRCGTPAAIARRDTCAFGAAVRVPAASGRSIVVALLPRHRGQRPRRTSHDGLPRPGDPYSGRFGTFAAIRSGAPGRVPCARGSGVCTRWTSTARHRRHSSASRSPQTRASVVSITRWSSSASPSPAEPGSGRGGMRRADARSWNTPPVQVCTIVARNYLAHARVLITSYLRHHPGARATVLLVDGRADEGLTEDDPFETVYPVELGIEPRDLQRMLLVYDVTEQSTALKPSFLKHLLARDGGSPVVYLDPDCQVFRSLDAIGDLATMHSLVLTPHVTSPIPAATGCSSTNGPCSGRASSIFGLRVCERGRGSLPRLVAPAHDDGCGQGSP